MLLCTFHVLKAVWKWLNIARNNIPKEHRQVHYKMFKNILYSTNKEALDVNIEYFNLNCKFENYKNYIVEKIEKDLDAWCLYHRKHLLTRGSDTNNIAEVMFRIFKDIPLERTKAHNLTQLADFVTTDFESYYKQRLLDLCFNKVTKSTINRLCPNAKDVSFSQIKQISDMEFCVLGNEQENKYFVDLSIGVCSCPVGFSGKICKHQSSIILNLHVDNIYNCLTDQNKKIFFKIATGSEPPQDLLMPLMKIADSKIQTGQQMLSGNELHDETHPSGLRELEVNESMDTCSDNNNTNFSNTARVEAMWSDFIIKFSEQVKTELMEDPLGFTPAIQSCVTAYEKNINSSSSLMSSLFTLFKPQSNNTTFTQRSFKYTARKGKKIGVQPTSVARRKTVATGRRRLQAGRHANKSLTKKKPKARHSLSECVEKNISLGDSKFSK